MNKIIKINQKLLDHLLQLRRQNEKFYFVPRKINNKGRLNSGYWFIGNQDYLIVSFWDGSDWKEKIHNISFVILEDGRTYIELSAQDSIQKSEFFEKLTKQIGGFKKQRGKNKWHKHYLGTDYLSNINDFIKNVKPKIDHLIAQEQPKGLVLLTEKSFKRYAGKAIELRNNQIDFGRINKISRICWNTKQWKLPSGTEGKSNSITSYESIYRYGHEEWLFDKSKIIDGYHYAFLEPLRLISDRHEGSNYNISLYTINNLNKKYYVGKIEDVHCILKDESIKIYERYKAKGWIEQMKNDLARVGADFETFLLTEPDIFFNIKFKVKDIDRPDQLIEISNSDINLTTSRFKLLPQKAELLFNVQPEMDGHEGNLRNTKTRKRVFNSESEFDPYHDLMQNKIFSLLKNSSLYDYKKVQIERDRVDIKALTQQNAWHYFELKTDSAKMSIRKALGQILEYAYFPSAEKAEKLIIVSDEKPDENAQNYIKYIRRKFNLPVTYRHFDFETGKLSDDY